MRKKLLITGFILVFIIVVFGILWRVFDLSTDYNYATAKLDIKDGDVKIIHVGAHQASPADKAIETVAARYGFKNIYVEKFTKDQTEKGIQNYNELIDTYLVLRNGPDWKAAYQKEVDSIYNAAAGKDNQ